MAQIYKDKEFADLFSHFLDENDIKHLMSMTPGQSDVFGFHRRPDIVFVRVTEHHMATMSVYEFNGIK